MARKLHALPLFVRSLWCAGMALAWWTSQAVAQSSDVLRYQLKAGESYVYQVEIRADRGDDINVLSGHPEFRVQSVDNGQAKVHLASSQLGDRTELKPGTRPRVGLPRFPSVRMPRSPFEFQGHEVVLNPRGQVVNERGTSQITYMLGHLTGLVFEAFPEEAQQEWSTTEKEIISITERSRFSSPFRGDTEVERLNSEQTIRYTIHKREDALVSIRRQVQLATVEKADDGPRLELQLDGDYVFDQQRGLPASMNYDGQVVQRKDNQSIKIPLTIRIHRLSDQELAEYRAKQAELMAEAKARLEQQAAERAKPLAADDRTALLANLQSGDKNRINDALRKLKDKTPPEGDAEIARHVAEQLLADDLFSRQYAAEALIRWGTAEEVPLLVKALDDSHHFVVLAALKALGQLKEPASYPSMTDKLLSLRTRTAASTALKECGSSAEGDVLPLLTHDDWAVRMEACQILEQIGTSKSAAALEQAQNDSNGLVKSRAKSALTAVQKRTAP